MNGRLAVTHKLPVDVGDIAAAAVPVVEVGPAPVAIPGLAARFQLVAIHADVTA